MREILIKPIRAMYVVPLVISCIILWAAPALGDAASAPATQPPNLTASDLESFLDALVPSEIQRDDIPGAVISVVKDGKLVLAKGYGLADIGRATPVDAQSTLFRIASISKLFTWTALMQLVEQGRISLDADVNTYLDFKIPATFAKPVTLRNCLTHTPGFEDVTKGLIVNDSKYVTSLGAYLKSHIPLRIYPPGNVIAYSNYCAGLAGYVVERVSGEPFDEYVARHILQPLGMAQSSMAQGLPTDLSAALAKGYKSTADATPKPFEWIVAPPAGGITSTATDMARFMLAYLNSGSFNGVQILRPETVALMHTPQVSLTPNMNGWCLGFYETSRNGHRIVSHGGDTSWFHTDLSLILDEKTGFFMALNGAGNDSGGARIVRMALFRAFLDRYFPHPKPQEQTVATASVDGTRVAGFYEISRRGASALQFAGAFGQIEVVPLGDSTIELRPFFTTYGETLKKWHEIAPLRYREVGGQSQVAFAADSHGDITAWTTDEYPPVFVFQRVTGMKQQRWVKLLLPAFAAVLAGSLLLWLIGAVLRRRYLTHLRIAQRRRSIRTASRVGVVVQAAQLLCGLAILIIVGGDDANLSPALDKLLYIFHGLSWLAVIGAAAIIANAAFCWQPPPAARLICIGETILAGAAIYNVWFIFAYDLLNFTTRF